MTSLPMRRAQFDMQGFAGWLANNGAEVAAPTNPYEVIRYRAYQPGRTRAATHVVYAKDNGLLNFQGLSSEHYMHFQDGSSITMRPMADGGVFLVTPPAPSKGAVAREALLIRDGDECWYCGLEMGADATIEHLVPKSKGGLNGIANYVLAHKRCNAAAADKPLVSKIEMRSRMRAENEPIPNPGAEA